MLSGTGSNRGTKCIPRLARFNPRLALIGFLGTRAWLFEQRLDGRARGAVFNFRYKLTNLVITNTFCHTLDPSLYRGSTVLNFIYLFFKKWGALAPPAPPPARALGGLNYRSIIQNNSCEI